MMIQQARKEREEEEGEKQTGPTTPQPGCFFCLLGFLQQPSHSQPASQPASPFFLPPLLPGAVAEAASAYSPRSQTCYSGIHKTHNTKSTKHKTYTQNTKGRFINTKHFLLLLHQAWTFSFLSSPHPFGVLQQRVISINFSSSKDYNLSSTICNCFSSKRCKSQLLFAFLLFFKKMQTSSTICNCFCFLFTHLCASSNIHQLLFFFKMCKTSSNYFCNSLLLLLLLLFPHPFVCIK